MGENPRASNPNAVEVMAITRYFGSIAAVKNLTSNVAAGSIFGLLGPNGAGKSTASKC